MRIAYVGPFAFPASHANSLRVRGMAQAMTQAGHEVTICPGMESPEAGAEFSSSIRVEGVNEYARRSGLSKIRGVRGMLIGDATIEWLRAQEKKPDAVVLYGTHLSYLWRLQKYAAHTKVKLLLDVVEWYDPRHLPGGLFGPFSAMNEWAMRHAAKNVDGLFVISSYLQSHFSKAGCRSLKVPPLFSPMLVDRPAPFRDTNFALNICYVGTPGRKEEFTVLFAGLKMARNLGVNVYTHMVGLSESEFRNNYPGAMSDGESKVSIKFYGRIPNEAAKLIVSSCDFMIVVRQKSRVTQAGFPSKVPESLSLGTPVIVNKFSDLEPYVRSGNAGLMIDTLSAEGVCAALLAAAAINEVELDRLKTSARNLAEKEFSPSSYAGKIDQFLREGS